MAHTSDEQLLEAWVGLTSLIKNTRLTREMSYNEAIVMMLLNHAYQEDGVGLVPLQYVLQQTKMLKSLLNRTVGLLEKKGYLIRSRGIADSRTVLLRPNPERLDDFLEEHRHSLEIAQSIIDIIGPDDADAFVRIYKKISAADANNFINTGK